jgi:hypothetical protein
LTATPYPVRAMLRTYGRQVTTARRLARFRRLQQLDGPDETDETALLREAKRRDLVRRVATEIVENCLVTGSDSPVVDEIKAELEEELGFPLAFAYPPEELEMQLFRLGGPAPVAVTGADKAVVLQRLWELTLEKVDETML